MAVNDLLGLIVAVALLLIPTLALSARFALKPIVESMLRIREALDLGRAPASDARLAALEARVEDMHETLERVAQAVEFDARLRQAPTPPQVSPPPGGPRLMRPPRQAPPGSAAPRLVRPAGVNPSPGDAQRTPDTADYEQEYL